MALIRHWLHHRESDEPEEFRREIGMALWLEKRFAEIIHPPERK